MCSSRPCSGLCNNTVKPPCIIIECAGSIIIDRTSLSQSMRHGMQARYRNSIQHTGEGWQPQRLLRHRKATQTADTLTTVVSDSMKGKMTKDNNPNNELGKTRKQTRALSPQNCTVMLPTSNTRMPVPMPMHSSTLPHLNLCECLRQQLAEAACARQCNCQCLLLLLN